MGVLSSPSHGATAAALYASWYLVVAVQLLANAGRQFYIHETEEDEPAFKSVVGVNMEE